MEPSLQRVANRWLIRQAAVVVVNEPLPRRARRDRAAANVRRELTAEVLEAFGSCVVNADTTRVASSITSKLKQLWSMFQSAPKKWEDFKKLVGVKATTWLGVARELPGKIKSGFKEAEKWLSKVGKTLVDKIPLLKLYLDVGIKLPSVGDWMARALDYMPEPIQKGIRAVATKARTLAEWLDELVRKYPVIKPASVLVSAFIFAVIWFNVVELSWDVPNIIAGFLGAYSFVELLHSLPESALGFLIGLLFPGIPNVLIFNAILPITIALRLAWLVKKHYIEYEPGKGFTVDWKKIGIEPPEGVPAERAI